MSKRTRAERRALTKRYVNKQKALATNYGYNSLDKQQLGRLKKHSHLDCGRGGCCMCLSPRRNKWTDGKNSKLTVQEIRNKDEYEAFIYCSGSSHREESEG